MRSPKIIISLFFMAIAIAVFATKRANTATVIIEQPDGSVSAGADTGCSNACHDVTMGSQVFAPKITADLGSLKVFTSEFRTNSSNFNTNDCYLTLYNEDTGTLLASSDNRFHGYDCAGDLLFSFQSSQPSLHAGGHYRWNYVFGTQNFSGISFLGSVNGKTGELFNVPPVAEAKFIAFSIIAAPTEADQSLSGSTSSLKIRGIIDSSTIMFGAVLPSITTDTLQLQVELEPSYITFKDLPNMESSFGPFGSSGSRTTISAYDIPNGAYHWQARSADALGNVSRWTPPRGQLQRPAFMVYAPPFNVVLRDITTSYVKNTQPTPCYGDGTVFSCALSPAFTHYSVGTPFEITKMVFNARNDGSNNCDGNGHYGAVITADGTTNSAIIASSTNSVLLGCSGTTLNNAELDFQNETIPSDFYLTFSAFDGPLQGGSAISLSNLAIYTTSTPAPTIQKEPVVIVPGILGSKLNRVFDGKEIWPDADTVISSISDSHLDDLALDTSGGQISGMEMNPSDIVRTVTTSIPLLKSDFYEPLIDSLVSAGYTEGTDLFVAPYDWRLDIANSVAGLNKVIERAASHSSNGKISLVAHSMGGLAIKNYLAHATDTSPIDKVIFAGVPQLGAPQMFKALQYGDALGFNLGPLNILNPKEVKSIAQNMPSAYQLIPSRRYVETQGGYVIDNRNGTHVALTFDQTSEFMASSSTDGRNAVLIDAADAFHAARDTSPAAAPSVYNIVGCQNPATAYGYLLQDDGTVDIIRGKGDGTVPLPSALNLADTYQNYFSLFPENGADHIGLINGRGPIALIDALIENSTSTLSLAALGISTSTEDCLHGRSQFRNETTIEVGSYGPLTLGAYDSQDRHTGPNADGNIDLQIPGSAYETIGTNGFLLLPASDTYRIAGNANGAGAFNIKVKRYDDVANLFRTETYIRVPLASTSTTFVFVLGSSTPTMPLSLDVRGDGTEMLAVQPTAVLSTSSSTDTTPPAIVILSIPEHVIKGTPVTFAFSATDELSGIATVNATLDMNPIASDTVMDNLIEGPHTFRVEAIDNAGNPRIRSISFQVVTDTGNAENIGDTSPAAATAVSIAVPYSGGAAGGAIRRPCKKPTSSKP